MGRDAMALFGIKIEIEKSPKTPPDAQDILRLTEEDGKEIDPIVWVKEGNGGD